MGSNTVHLLVVDAHPGARPLPAYSHKTELRLAELIDEDGAIGDARRGPAGRYGRATRCGWPRTRASRTCCRSPPPRSARRPTARRCSPGSQRETGVGSTVLSGEDEARLTFLAVRRWFGWSAGRLLVLDIGGGSLEMASGLDEYPDAAVSLPLGAGRLTGGWLPGDPPAPGRRAGAAQARAGGDRPYGRRLRRLGAPGPRGRHVQDLPAARPDRGRRAPGGGPVRAAHAAPGGLEEWMPRAGRR